MFQLRVQLLRNLSPSVWWNSSKILNSSTFVDHKSAAEPNLTNQNGSTENVDEYTAEFLKNRIPLTGIQKTILSFGSSLTALLDPTRQDMIACLGETTGESALQNILTTMQNDEEGRQILAEKPRINTKTVNLEKLRQMPSNTLGYTYAKFLDDNQVTPDSRMEVRFIENSELAYVMTRYRECHDLIHAALGMPTNMLGEVAVKWVEAFNTGLPMCYGGAVFGAIRLRPKQRQQYLSKYLPWAITNGKNAKFLLSIYWEKRWEQDLAEMHKELSIKPFSK